MMTTVPIVGLDNQGGTAVIRKNVDD